LTTSVARGHPKQQRLVSRTACPACSDCKSLEAAARHLDRQGADLAILARLHADLAGRHAGHADLVVRLDGQVVALAGHELVRHGGGRTFAEIDLARVGAGRRAKQERIARRRAAPRGPSEADVDRGRRRCRDRQRGRQAMQG
jgi:hypothetical protein